MDSCTTVGLLKKQFLTVSMNVAYFPRWPWIWTCTSDEEDVADNDFPSMAIRVTLKPPPPRRTL